MMKWRRWLFGIACIIALAGLYSARRSIVTSFLSSRFSASIDSRSLETSFEDSSLRFDDTRVELSDGRRISIDSANATIDSRSIWKRDLVVDQLDLQGVRVPVEIPISTPLTLPTLPDEFGAPPDIESWISVWLKEWVDRVDREADRVLVSSQELQSRAEQLQLDLDQAIASNPSNLHDRKFAQLMAREYHAIKQRLAEIRIQARHNGKDHSKRWAGVEESISEKLQTKLRELAPDADRQIQQLATVYSQRVTPTVLGYCDIVATGMIPRTGLYSNENLRGTTLIRKASLAGELVDPNNKHSPVAFECQGCQWAWNSATKLPTTSLWSFELPDGQGTIEIHAEQRLSRQAEQRQQSSLHLDCYWYLSKQERAFQANPSRVRIEVQQSDHERLVSVTAPWHSRQEDLATQQLGLSPLAISFRQTVRTPDRSKPRSIPVAWESVAVEPRILFEMENALEYRKQRWMSEAQNRWNEIGSVMVSSEQERSVQLWQRISTQTMDLLMDLETRLRAWQERWDSSTTIQQHRVGSKLSVHPDSYSLGTN